MSENQSLKLPSDTLTAINGNYKPDNFNLYFNKFRKWKFDRGKEEVEYLPDKVIFNFPYQKKAKTDQYEILVNFKQSGYEIVLLKGKVDWKMVVGLGNEHIKETSMTLHHIYGIPYIPGSAIKGVLRNKFINETAEDIQIENDSQILVIEKVFENFDKDNKISFDEFKKKFTTKDNQKKSVKPSGKTFNYFLKHIQTITEFQTIFGTQNQKGKVVFLAAYPIGKINIENDIMTPHYGPYYSDETGKIPPADYFDPNPIKFLTVKKTEFQFGIIIKSNDIEKTKIFNFLKSSLQEHGIGAKTAVGYGYFENIKDASNSIEEHLFQKKKNKKEEEKKKKFDSMPELDKKLFKLTQEKNPEYSRNYSMEFFNKIDDFSGEEKRKIAKVLQEVWKKLNIWKKQKKKQKERVKIIKQILDELF